MARGRCTRRATGAVVVLAPDRQGNRGGRARRASTRRRRRGRRSDVRSRDGRATLISVRRAAVLGCDEQARPYPLAPRALGARVLLELAGHDGGADADRGDGSERAPDSDALPRAPRRRRQPGLLARLPRRVRRGPARPREVVREQRLQGPRDGHERVLLLVLGELLDRLLQHHELVVDLAGGRNDDALPERRRSVPGTGFGEIRPCRFRFASAPPPS